jgi:hypothetical protein
MTMYTDDDGALAVKLARSTIEHAVGGSPLLDLAFTECFRKNAGAFVTLNTYPEKRLRGCIGYPEPFYKLEESIRRGAQSATRDPRFPPLAMRELPGVVVEVSILTPPEKIVVQRAADYPKQVVVGRDGLIIGKKFHRGLLLPQVATEYGWDSKEFLAETCMKAGLMPDAWLDGDAEIWRFSAEIFGEDEPRGPPRRKGP